MDPEVHMAALYPKVPGPGHLGWVVKPADSCVTRLKGRPRPQPTAGSDPSKAGSCLAAGPRTGPRLS